ncbi:putative F-box domain, leucine-rich repeat domain superfamily, F-box-like domain superfamily [Helianthus annuus]|nr:putative F-box domain, leucine-rich repeat domain superfamily, F-box-like domain superfamily [Helianthus annuus]
MLIHLSLIFFVFLLLDLLFFALLRGFFRLSRFLQSYSCRNSSVREDVLYHGMPKYQTLEESDIFLSLGQHVDVYFPTRKRSRVTAPFVFSEPMFKKQKTTIDVLPDECLFEILRRVSGGQEKSSCASVSKRWLMLLSTIHRNEQKEAQEYDKSGGSITRCLKGKKATDIRLAAIGVGSNNRGGLGELAILGNNSSKVTDFGLMTVARGCPSLTSLTLWNLSSIKDDGVTEIANECRLLEKVELSHCPGISDKSLIAIANNCPNLTSLSIESCANIGNEGLQAIGKSCPRLKSISIKNCPLVGDQGVVSLVTSASSSLMKLRLQGLTVSDMSLAVIGHYGLALTDLELNGLNTVTGKGFWVMGSGQGLQKLKSIVIANCNGVTDLGLEALGRGCPNLKQASVQKSAFLSDNGIVAFAKVTQSVETVNLEECHAVTQLGIFGLLVNCSTLKALSLTKCLGIKDLPMVIPSGLSPCNSLTSLSVRNCSGFGNFSLGLMGQLCHNLEDIVLTGLHGITDSGLTSLIKNCESGLTKVNLSGCVNLTDKIVSEISMVHGATLEVLNLDGCRSITDAGVVTVARNCFSLRELDVSKSAITDFSVAALACSEQVNLQVLSISGCQVSNKSLPFLKKLGETLIGLNMMQCRGVSSSAVGLLGEQIWKCDILV